MGYYASMTNVNFYMDKVNKRHAYEAFKKSSLASDALEPIHSIEDALDYFGYTAENDEEDNIISLEHNTEKLGDEEMLFFVIAPYVRSGSFIEMIGENNEMWRWFFLNGELKESTPKIEWEI